MNKNIRDYLIKVARHKEKFVYYSDVVKDCDLDIDLSYMPDHDKLGNLLREVSEYENKYDRPLLTSLVIYKDPKKNDHGGGFYRLASYLGFGDINELQDRLFGFEEATKCRLFWQNENNYKQYALMIEHKRTIQDLFRKLTEVEEGHWIVIWKNAYLKFVNEIQELSTSLNLNPIIKIDDNYHYKKLSSPINSYEGFMRKWLKEKTNGISSRGQSVLSEINFRSIINDDSFKTIARNILTVPNISNYNLLRNWWDSNELISNRPLLINRAFAACNPEYLSSTVDNSKFWDVVIILIESYGFDFQRDHKGNWFLANEELTEWLNIQLAQELKQKSKNRLEQIIWRNIFVWLIYEEYSSSESIPPNQLIKKEKPKNGFVVIPETKKKFNGVDIDFISKAKEQKDLGDAGEELVKQFEIQFLNSHKRNKESKEVRIVEDGEGYDIYSFDQDGNEKFIEVKTTVGKELTPFYLSDNEACFMRENPKNYSIYRVYNFDEENNSGEFFEIKGDVESQLLMIPTEFRVLIKKENI